MYKQGVYIVYCLAFLVVLLVGGCKQQFKAEKETEAVVVGIDKYDIASDYAQRAIDTAGGRQAWKETEVLNFDCVVTFYRPDGTFYLTEQRHEVYPWANRIMISARQPKWEIAEQTTAVPASQSDRYFAEAVFNLTTAPARLLDELAWFGEEPEIVRFEGLSYYAIERTMSHPDAPRIGKVVFLQQVSSSVVDVILFADVGGTVFLAARGYDYVEPQPDSICMPSKIEIFSTDAKGILQRRLAKIDLK
ncbi:MAG: hypothetical protein MUO22_00070 [Sedimentisphaerales bacterium]|nr:hypothetical protein [Sedimentisphaerales bacterium]